MSAPNSVQARTGPSSPATHPGNNFDAIRIVAATMVLYSHHFALTGQMEPSFFGIHSLGGLAVTIFFVLSGYLVNASWQRDPNLWRFGLRRFLRIWPALTVAVVLTAYVLGAWVTQLPLKEYLTHRATANYLQALGMKIQFVLPGVFENNPYRLGVNGSLWTIPIEVRCYIALGLAGLIGLLKYRPVLLLSIAVLIGWFLARSNPDLTGTVNHSRELSAFFLAGAALYTLEPYWRRRPALWGVVIGLATAMIWMAGWRHSALLMGLPFFIIYAGTQTTAYVRRAGRWGDPSYGIYLFAFPIQQTVIQYGWPQLGFAGTLAVSLIITVALAYASWHLVEKQALRFKPSSSEAWFGASAVRAVKTRFLTLTELQYFAIVLGFIGVVYAAWLVASWPGILGQDSLAIMLEVDTDRVHQANKPAFWYLYALLTYGATGRVEVPIALQMLICAAVCARILAWMLTHRMWKSFAYCLIFVALAPSVVYYSSSFYSDGIYAISLSGMMFEVWRSIRNRSVDLPSLLIFFVTIPFAIFGRPNGVLNLIPLAALAWMLSKPYRVRMGLVIVPWLVIGFGSQFIYKYENPIGSVFPLALYETVGFLEHRPMGLWEHNQPRVTTKTVDALTSTGQSLDKIREFHDHYYWDPLIFFPAGPALLSLSDKSKRTIIKEFFKYNLWHNFPAFMASRVNIFLYAAMANGGIPGPPATSQILPLTKSISSVQPLKFSLRKHLHAWYDFSIQHRAIMWAPWGGLVLLMMALRRSMKQRDKVVTLIAGTYALQLVAIFIFSIAGEYRYLLAFFTAPLVLLPVLCRPSEKENA
ncbi:acyltransferase [Acidovorax sp.]|uniref:acyltransferase family protein n=1 Tax=Acidovorax sp. TaxID=1872122 RepID=UPI00261C588D|nr:acyltransferase [Acidovorax sp.]